MTEPHHTPPQAEAGRTKKCTFELPLPLWKALAHLAIDRDTSQQALVIQALQRLVDEAGSAAGGAAWQHPPHAP